MRLFAFYVYGELHTIVENDLALACMVEDELRNSNSVDLVTICGKSIDDCWQGFHLFQSAFITWFLIGG